MTEAASPSRGAQASPGGEPPYLPVELVERCLRPWLDAASDEDVEGLLTSGDDRLERIGDDAIAARLEQAGVLERGHAHLHPDARHLFALHRGSLRAGEVAPVRRDLKAGLPPEMRATACIRAIGPLGQLVWSVADERLLLSSLKDPGATRLLSLPKPGLLWDPYAPVQVTDRFVVSLARSRIQRRPLERGRLWDEGWLVLWDRRTGTFLGHRQVDGGSNARWWPAGSLVVALSLSQPGYLEAWDGRSAECTPSLPGIEPRQAHLLGVSEAHIAFIRPADVEGGFSMDFFDRQRPHDPPVWRAPGPLVDFPKGYHIRIERSVMDSRTLLIPARRGPGPAKDLAVAQWWVGNEGRPRIRELGPAHWNFRLSLGGGLVVADLGERGTFTWHRDGGDILMATGPLETSVGGYPTNRVAAQVVEDELLVHTAPTRLTAFPWPRST